MTQGAIWNIFRMLRLTPWILGRFIYFLDPCLFVILWKNGWTDFHEIFMKHQAWHKKELPRLSHICLDCFTVSHLGAPGVFVSNTMVKSMSAFSWNFQDMLAMTQGTIWNISGMIGLTPWTQGSFFYFLGPCLLATSRNTAWMDIHEIFRIWTQEAIGYTVSRLSRLFHPLQTRSGGGLRSRNASCSKWVFLKMLEFWFEFLNGLFLQINVSILIKISKLIILNENVSILFKILLKFAREGSVDNKAALV